MLESREKATPGMFGELLRNASMGDLRNCPVRHVHDSDYMLNIRWLRWLNIGPPLPQSQCGQQLRMARVLLNSPEIITIGLVWDSDHSDLAEDVIHTLGTCLRLGDVRNTNTAINMGVVSVQWKKLRISCSLCSCFTGWWRRRLVSRSCTWWAWCVTTGNITPPSSSRRRSDDGCTSMMHTSRRYIHWCLLWCKSITHHIAGMDSPSSQNRHSGVCWIS